MARACGAHQGAGVTSAGFETSGDLKAANEERDELEAGAKGPGEASEDEDELVATARVGRCVHAHDARVGPRSETGARSDSELSARSIVTVPRVISVSKGLRFAKLLYVGGGGGGGVLQYTCGVPHLQ